MRMVAVCNDCCVNVVPDARGPERESVVVVDAVLTASRVLVAVAARSLADVADEVTLTQYRWRSQGVGAPRDVRVVCLAAWLAKGGGWWSGRLV
jgi:hypothetical protein